MTHETVVVLAAEDAKRGLSVIDLVVAGGPVGYIIIVLSVVAMALVVLHLYQLRESVLAPPEAVDRLDTMLRQGKTADAMRFCEDATNHCFLTRVMGVGLSRYRRSPFGALELKSALEDAGQERVARLYRSTDGLALIASIAPMLGLLGTVVGINGAFSTISQTEGFARPDQLAGDISLALVTTIQGLLVAIPVIAAVTFFRNRIDTLASDVGEVIDALASHLESEARPAEAARPGPSGQPRPVATETGA
jgi:biopolymer transport protein ExbB